MKYSEYYQSHIPQQNCWLLTGLLRSCEHVAFDRTVDVPNSIFEFFVPADQEEEFVFFMNAMIRRGIILDLKKLPNRIKTEQQSL